MFRHKITFSRSSSVDHELDKFLAALSHSGLPKNSTDFLAEQVSVALNRFSRSANFSNSVFEGDGYRVTIVAASDRSGIISKLINIIKGH